MVPLVLEFGKDKSLKIPDVEVTVPPYHLPREPLVFSGVWGRNKRDWGATQYMGKRSRSCYILHIIINISERDKVIHEDCLGGKVCLSWSLCVYPVDLNQGRIALDRSAELAETTHGSGGGKIMSCHSRVWRQPGGVAMIGVGLLFALEIQRLICKRVCLSRLAVDTDAPPGSQLLIHPCE